MEVAVLLEPTRAVVRSGVPMKKASAPSARQARAKTLANIIFDSGIEKKGKKREVGEDVWSAGDRLTRGAPWISSSGGGG